MKRNNKGQNTQLTDEEFLARVKSKLDYIEVLGKYEGSEKRIKYKCTKCGYIGMKQAKLLTAGHGCPICTHSGKYPQYVFLQKVKLYHPNIQILSEYKNCKSLVKCKCSICGYEWETRATNVMHKKGGCPKCKHYSPPRTHEQYVKKVKEINPNIIIISHYTRSDENITCKCKICGCKWTTCAHTITQGHGCPKCKGLKDRITHEEFVTRMKDINPFVEVVGKYETMETKIEMKCLICGQTWKASPQNLLHKTGCPYCKCSKGEREIMKILDKHNVSYEWQKSYNDLIGLGGGKLAYDFYIPNYNLLIEYQGRQHERVDGKFFTQDIFEYIKEHDNRKKQYAKEHNIELLEIWYYENIEEKLIKTLNLETVTTAG